MNASLGRIKAQLAEPVVDRLAKLVQLINENINPPGPVGEKDVHIRAMYIVSDEVNSFGGRFPSDELDHLAELLVDSPVMVGHRKDKLPVARTFHAETVDRDGRSWVKSYFYWLRSSGGADDLMQNIDAGIYKECSIGFTYMFPECSVCGKDIRGCRHEPFEQYAKYIAMIADDVTDDLKHKYPDKEWLRHLDEAVDSVIAICEITPEVARRAVNASVARK